jgi:hypothetical protein
MGRGKRRRRGGSVHRGTTTRRISQSGIGRTRRGTGELE